MQPDDQYISMNHRAWNEIADVRQRSMHWPSASFFSGGGSILNESVRAAAGDVRGKTLLHLQCATGEETLSWAVAGAQATGVDLSERQIEIATQKAADAGLPVRFVAADVYNMPADLASSNFDILYTGGGALVWLPDIAWWGRIVAAALRPGGRLILDEEHPLAGCLVVQQGHLAIAYDYFGRAVPDIATGWGHFSGAEDAKEPTAEFSWPLGDVLTALAQSGLRIESLQEFPSQAAWRFGALLDQVRHLPGRYLLVARKE